MHLEYRELGIFKDLRESDRNRRRDTFGSLAHGDVANSNLS
jgi:hypothetical protein